MSTKMSTRAEVLHRRTYSRPLNDKGTKFETWEQTIHRVVKHQAWLWARASGQYYNEHGDYGLQVYQQEELDELESLLLSRKASVAGRTLWLGGTEVSRRREASQFNCSFLQIETVRDVVDALWLLMQGCGVGFHPIIGTLNGFLRPIPRICVDRTRRKGKGGSETNSESYNPESGVWKITVGDSAEAWAKSIGKILAGKYPANELVLDFTQLRPAGERLKGYGWISAGDEAISKAFVAICEIMNKKAGQLLSRMDILDVMNWLGTILSSRRSAEIALFTYGQPEWEEFAEAKKEVVNGRDIHRCQSNNSLVFYRQPTKSDLESIFILMGKAGGSEPGFINANAALSRAPWFKGVNPCAEILLGNKSFCNLTEVDLNKFKGDTVGLHRAIYLIARANYRQTLVNLNDGILQEAWHKNNEFLRLCGVGLTGIAGRDDLTAYDYRQLKNIAVSAAYSMADELGLNRPKNVTTIKPSGTISKLMDTTEGVHKPLGKYIFNNINFSNNDPLVAKLSEAGYKVQANPFDNTGSIVCFPVKNDSVKFTEVDGKEVNLESAISQLDKYKLLMDNYVEQNCSVTISYSVDEVEAIIDWLLKNWDSYVGVSFIYRNDPTKTAKDLGYLYLPQEVTTKEIYEEYVSKLKPVDFKHTESFEEISNDECESGVCPIK